MDNVKPKWRVIYFDHIDIDDDKDSVPGVTFLGGHVSDVAGPDSVKFIDHAALISAQEERDGWKDSCAVLEEYNKELREEITYQTSARETTETALQNAINEIARLEKLLQDSVVLLKTRDEEIARLEKELAEARKQNELE